jgi:hypothetical protein
VPQHHNHHNHHTLGDAPPEAGAGPLSGEDPGGDAGEALPVEESARAPRKGLAKNGVMDVMDVMDVMEAPSEADLVPDLGAEGVPATSHGTGAVVMDVTCRSDFAQRFSPSGDLTAISG